MLSYFHQLYFRGILYFLCLDSLVVRLFDHRFLAPLLFSHSTVWTYIFKTPIFFSFILIQTVFKMAYFEVTSSKWIRQVMVLGMFVIEVTSTLYGHILPESRQLDSRQLVVIEVTSILYVHILTDTRQLDSRLSVVILVTSSLYGPLSTESRLKKLF